jgi:hypothetical protein
MNEVVGFDADNGEGGQQFRPGLGYHKTLICTCPYVPNATAYMGMCAAVLRKSQIPEILRLKTAQKDCISVVSHYQRSFYFLFFFV